MSGQAAPTRVQTLNVTSWAQMVLLFMHADDQAASVRLNPPAGFVPMVSGQTGRQSLRFETMPSSPSPQAWRKTVSPSPSMCSLSRMPAGGSLRIVAAPRR